MRFKELFATLSHQHIFQRCRSPSLSLILKTNKKKLGSTYYFSFLNKLGFADIPRHKIQTLSLYFYFAVLVFHILGVLAYFLVMISTE